MSCPAVAGQEIEKGPVSCPLNPTKSPPRRPHPNPLADTSTLWLLLAVGLLAIFALYWWQGRNDRSEISYGFFRHQLEDEKNVVRVNVEGAKLYGEFKEAPIDPDAEKDSERQLPEAKEEVRHDRAADGPGRSGAGPDAARESEGRVRQGSAPEARLQSVGAGRQHGLAADVLYVGPGRCADRPVVSVRQVPRLVLLRRFDRRVCQERGAALRGWPTAGDFRGRGRPGRGQERLAGNRRVPAEPGQVPAAGGPRAQGNSADGSAGHGQDAAGPGRGRRGGRALLFDQRLGVHPDVRRRGRRPRPRPVQHGQGTRPRHPVHRRDRRRGPPPRRRRGRRTRRTRANAQPNPQRDGRLHARTSR